jgi:4-diphosphocytidyl-2-C-methyl-D-erythritol kinase
LPSSWLVLVKPDFQVSTRWAYENFDRVWINEKRLVGTHQPLAGLTLYNDLEKVVLPKHPKVSEIKKRLIQLGCLQAIMTGSGPAVFGLARDEKTAQQVFQEIKKEYPQSYLVSTVNSGVVPVR